MLVFEQIAFSYTHNLRMLSNLIPEEWSIAQVEADLERLSEYAVETRYPGDPRNYIKRSRASHNGCSPPL